MNITVTLYLRLCSCSLESIPYQSLLSTLVFQIKIKMKEDGKKALL